jgi:two-component system NtrC family sensor kinase
MAHDTQSLQSRVKSLQALEQIGRKVTALLDLDSVLTAVVDAAVDLTGAEEGSLLLLDPNSGDLTIRAARNFQESFVRTFRLPVQDTLAGQVIHTGKPVLLDQKTPKKIKTEYLVYTLIYVPIQVQEKVIGVLGVDNRNLRQPFSDDHLTLVSALADYAAIAIENARLFAHSEQERTKLQTILAGIGDSVIVVDPAGKLILMNRSARENLSVPDEDITGRDVRDVISHTELVEILSGEARPTPFHIELSLDNGRVFNTQVTPIPSVGLGVTMQDITHLKELDRIKSEFVSTVSHDLRSPLTAILGYVELIERIGPVNEMQHEFIQRVQASVNSITALINDLLDLGRIEAGFDSRKEIVHMPAIIQYSLEGLRPRAVEKSQNLVVETLEELPQVFGNPVHLRQMVSNLLNNAIKYTQPGGNITIRARAESDQIILQVLDNGPGIPSGDQPYVFDKFYRASNIQDNTPGTGLGLAIVKSIVENHQGRIWLDSSAGQGTTFNVVLPTVEGEKKVG